MVLIVANWKMYKTYAESIQFAREHRDELDQYTSWKQELVIAPSFLAFDALNTILAGTGVGLCAQDCASYASGPYTGEIDAASLAQLDCNYALVGHSERRRYFGETDELIAKKITLLFENNITPIICIGETKEDYINGNTQQVLEAQVEPFIDILDNQSKDFYFAYEPEWAIGTGKTPSADELYNILSWIGEPVRGNGTCATLYGGSVDETNAKELLQIPRMGGFLIGKASCDFQSLKKIVSLA
jgi:triosephosphate isomerase